MSKQECKKSPDGKHHYEMSMGQHAIYIENGSHTCYHCHYCHDNQCKTEHYGDPNPLELPTLDELIPGHAKHSQETVEN